MVKRLIAKIENTQAPLHAWLLSLAAIIIIRVFLENFSSNKLWNYPADFYTVFLHYPLIYLNLLLVHILIIHKVTKLPVKNITKLGIYSLPIIWLAPVLDLIINATRSLNFIQSYIITPPSKLLGDFFTLFGPLLKQGITPGIRIEIIILLILIFLYVRFKTKSLLKSVVTVILSYSSLFIIGSLPSFAFLFHQLFSGSILNTSILTINTTFAEIFSKTPILPPASFNLSGFFPFIEGWNRFLSWIYLVSLFILITVWYQALNGSKWKAFWKNSRPERLFYYIALVGIGVWSTNALEASGTFGVGFWLSFIVLFLAFTASWLFAIHINDKHDLLIDRISNKKRPLVSGILTIEDYREANLILGAFILFAGISLGQEIMFLLLTWHILAYTYSAPPFRFKKIFPVSNIIMGFAAIILILIGFVLASGISYIYFPLKSLIILFIIFGSISTVKDLKDARGDKANNIKTLANISSRKKNLFMMSVLITLAFLLVNVLIKSLAVGMVSVGFAVLSIWFLFSKYFKERFLFYGFFLYLLIIAVTLYFVR